MQDFIDAAKQLITLAGPYYMYALAGAFVVMVSESAKPAPPQDEPKGETGPLNVVVSILNLITPFLLFVHGYIAAARAHAPMPLIAALIVVGGVVVAAAIVGWIIAAAVKPLGRVLLRVMPFAAIAVFAFTLWVTRANLAEAFTHFVLRR